MELKTIHRILGICISVFVAIHLFNHSLSYYGAEAHIEFMEAFRNFYRTRIVESILLIAICMQIMIGIRLSVHQSKNSRSLIEKAKVYSGWYMAFFFIVHLSAVLFARIFLDMDTNFYFGVAGLNTFPLNLFFIPYYYFGVLAFFVHIAAVHRHKMKYKIFYLTPKQQALCILIMGIVVSSYLIFVLSNKFQGFNIPYDYQIIK